MPVVAVIGGIASAAAGATAFAAAGGFAAGITLGTVAAGLSIVGGVASALGGLTGNKKLMKIGMIAGLGGAALGGLGSLTSSASDAAKSSVAGAGVSESAGLGADVFSGPSAVTSAVAPQNILVPSQLPPLAPPGDTGMLGFLTNSSTEAAGRAALQATAPPPPSSVPGSAIPGTVTPQSQLLSPSEIPGQSAFSQTNIPSSAPTTTAATSGAPIDIGGQVANRSAPGTSSLMDSAGGAFKKFGGMLSSNPELGKIAMSALSGVSQQKAEELAIERARLQKEFDRDRYNNSIRNQVYR